jgi:hypothetical protein
VNTFRSYLTEVFDRPLPVREMKRIGYGPTTIEVTYQAQTENGQYLNIDISKIKVSGWEINFTVDGSHDLTHAGKPYRILATVVEAVRLFLKDHMESRGELPKELDMVSKTSEGKRDAVYSAMMKRFGKEFGYKITDKFVTNRFSSPENQRTVTTARLTEARDYKAEYAKMYGGNNPTPKQRKAMKKKTSRKRILRKMGREGKSTDGREIDHKDGNALNNGKKNIRLVSRATNRSKDNNKWR